mmetsp:Transcript_1970/g.6482  ORF Transcript_1970/g.6482 Transcript_1970/m.6482 type:complete len:289 (+) Transcript_1970:99-965(+)
MHRGDTQGATATDAPWRCTGGESGELAGRLSHLARLGRRRRLISGGRGGLGGRGPPRPVVCRLGGARAGGVLEHHHRGVAAAEADVQHGRERLERLTQRVLRRPCGAARPRHLENAGRVVGRRRRARCRFRLGVRPGRQRLAARVGGRLGHVAELQCAAGGSRRRLLDLELDVDLDVPFEGVLVFFVRFVSLDVDGVVVRPGGVVPRRLSLIRLDLSSFLAMVAMVRVVTDGGDGQQEDGTGGQPAARRCRSLLVLILHLLEHVVQYLKVDWLFAGSLLPRHVEGHAV